ncbi:aminotransferase class V-fold PLP-dependent enzyme [Methyloradius palustris]|uniref:Isopenicillin-N epimerase n=1 Tax=Methyloradius palustris TaxID=2778876 RepID=A0A8D5G7H9_9PROT|nr:aminotransferase class V-fold PLP-dependent enzyme [Methyloradius palustris]BCM24577.1 isopenicillin-N epimerase [Methyloradius palustris]
MQSKWNHQSEFNAGLEMRKHWMLDDEISFLNHGSFGATPKVVLQSQQDYRALMERQPVDFFVRQLPDLIRKAAADLAGFLGANPDDLAFVENATAGINAVLRSFPWRAGDELLLANHAYPAVKNAAYFVARQFGITVREFEVPFPLEDENEILQAFTKAISPNTRMAVLDHVSSPLAIIYPLEKMLVICRAHSVKTLVDGAHAPGMLPLNLDAIDADWYVGNCHKWLFAAKGCAFLWAAPHARDFLQPMSISLHADVGFPQSFDWVGTRDVSAWLSISAAIDFYKSVGGDEIPEKLHNFAIVMAQQLAADWHVDLPAKPAMFGSMVTLPMPFNGEATQETADQWRDTLWHENRIEVPFFAINRQLWLRISAQLYNSSIDYEQLSQAVTRKFL